MGNDLWRTPDWLYLWLNDLYGPFDIDLAASAVNAKHPNYYSIQHDALTQRWYQSHANGFCNPPYSNLPPWLSKARQENEKGFKSTWVLPAWNGDKHWRFSVYELAAAQVTQIYGRLAFLDHWGNPIPGNRGGTVIVHYNGKPNTAARLLHVTRDDLVKQYQKLPL